MDVASGMREGISEGLHSEAEARRDVNVIYKKSSKCSSEIENRELKISVAIIFWEAWLRTRWEGAANPCSSGGVAEFNAF
jgi:hypothetical protein